MDFSKFKSGLNRPARLASWGVAIGIGLYLAKRREKANSVGEFTEQEQWNKKVLDKTKTKPVAKELK
jgi:hypothetical protein